MTESAFCDTREIEQSFQDDSESLPARARKDAATYGIPAYYLKAYLAQYWASCRRGIEFRFTLLGWQLWWLGELRKKGPDARRGLRSGQFMMCRFGDKGPYEAGNVYCGTHKDNMSEPHLKLSKSAAVRQWHATHVSHLKGKVGEDHPKAHGVMTPNGWFGSIAMASRFHSITRQGGVARIKSGAWQRVASAPH